MQFGDVPLVLEATKSPRLDFYSFTSESILKCMKEELSQYVEYIPETADYGTPNRAAGYHLLTKLCLATSDFDGAIAAADKIINDGKHRLMTSRFGALASCKTVGDNEFKSAVDKGYRTLAIGANTPSMLFSTSIIMPTSQSLLIQKLYSLLLTVDLLMVRMHN